MTQWDEILVRGGEGIGVDHVDVLAPERGQPGDVARSSCGQPTTEVVDPYGRSTAYHDALWDERLLDSLVPGGLEDYEIDSKTNLGKPDIPAGDIIFFDGIGGHVMISLGTRDAQGRQEVLSN